jgi:RND family efflux transporter MFP subunit
VTRPWPLAFLVLLTLAACKPTGEAEAPVPPRPVRTIAVAPPSPARPETFVGRIEARDVVDLGFRIGGRMTERLVNVGAQVRPGQALARLDPEVETNELRSARARLVAAESAERQAVAQFGRTKQLLERGIIPAAEFEAAEQARQLAQSQREGAAARVRIAEDAVGYTVLSADAEGVVTGVSAEAGEVVAAGRPVVRLARREGRDAVIDVPAAALDRMTADSAITVRVATDQAVTAQGRVREVSPEADPATRLFRIRIGLSDPPPAMLIGVSVQVSVEEHESVGIRLPASALMPGGSGTAVLVVDEARGKVIRRPVDLGPVGPDTIVVLRGLAPGEVVVTAGTSTLKDGQAVRVAGGPR